MQITVRLGQTVSTIAQRYHSSVAAIAAANGLADPDKIKLGQKLTIPDGKDDPIRRVCPMPADGFKPTSGTVYERLRAEQARRDQRASAPAAPAAPRRASTLSETDINALTRAVAAEARGESPRVWAGIAQTIINYAKQTGQEIHHLVRTGYLSSNYDGNRRFYTMPLSRIPNAAGIREAVLAAGAGESPVGNRTHFYDTSIRMPGWGDRGSRVQMGHIVFLNSK